MKIDVNKRNENKFFNREEISFSVEFEKTIPKREEIKEELCKSLNLQKELCVLRRLRSSFGSKRLIGEIFVYKNKDELMKFEPKFFLIRDGFIKEEEKETKEEGKEEKEKKEEKKKE
jgi:small subunit ribosomal protein S24e